MTDKPEADISCWWVLYCWALFRAPLRSYLGNENKGVSKYGICPLTLLHSERPKLYAILAFLSATGLIIWNWGITKKWENSWNPCAGWKCLAVKWRKDLLNIRYQQVISEVLDFLRSAPHRFNGKFTLHLCDAQVFKTKNYEINC